MKANALTNSDDSPCSSKTKLFHIEFSDLHVFVPPSAYPTFAAISSTHPTRLNCACVNSEMLDSILDKMIAVGTDLKGDHASSSPKESHHRVHRHIETSHSRSGCGKFLKQKPFGVWSR
jgi:hypothetical protein